MKTTLLVAFLVFIAVWNVNLAQETCEQVALAEIDSARADYMDDINEMFTQFEAIADSYSACQSSVAQAELSTSQVVDGGHVIEGLWSVNLEYTLSDACDERKKHETSEFYEDVYYSDSGLLVWDGGSNYSNFTFEYLLARRYTVSEGNPNWVSEYQITAATETSLSGMYAGYWQGNKDTWCSRNGTFTGEFFDSDNACLISGEANIRTNPSTKSPTNGKIDYQRRVVAKVLGDDDFFWWQLSDDEYVREDVIGASRSCERL